MSESKNYVQCGLCGHRHPKASLRRRGYVTCTCGIRIGSEPAAVIRRGLPLVGRNETWKSDLIDLTDPRWAEFLVGELATAAARKGFDGFFLDTLDSVELVAPGNAERTAALRRGLVATIRSLRAAFPQKRIVINRGLPAFAELRDVVDGVLVE